MYLPNGEWIKNIYVYIQYDHEIKFLTNIEKYNCGWGIPKLKSTDQRPGQMASVNNSLPKIDWIKCEKYFALAGVLLECHYLLIMKL